jgi:hypothetical protein
MNSQINREARAVAYLRIGSGAADDAMAQRIDLQRHGCEQIARRFGAQLVREYIDVGKPARLEQQAELQRLLADLSSSHDAAYVVVWDFTRLARDLSGLDDIIERIRDCGAEVATMTGVEVAERFMRGLLAGETAIDIRQSERPVLYPLGLLRAAHRGLGADEALAVRAVMPNGGTIRGQVVGIGSLLSISTAGGRLVEDVRAEWVVRAEIRQAPSSSRREAGHDDI